MNYWRVFSIFRLDSTWSFCKMIFERVRGRCIIFIQSIILFLLIVINISIWATLSLRLWLFFRYPLTLFVYEYLGILINRLVFMLRNNYANIVILSWWLGLIASSFNWALNFFNFFLISMIILYNQFRNTFWWLEISI